MHVLLAAISLAGAQAASTAQAEPSAQIVAQALDRCMATYAVRLTKTDASDEAIFTEATTSCLPLNVRLRAAINAQLPPPQAAGVIRSFDAQAKPNFMTMLAKIRSDRASKPDQ